MARLNELPGGNEKPRLSLDEIYILIDDFIFGVQSGKYDCIGRWKAKKQEAVDMMEDCGLYHYSSPSSKNLSFIKFTDKAYAMMAAGGMKNYIAKLESDKPVATAIHVGGDFTGNLFNQSSLDKSFNAEAISSTPTKKSKITVELIVKLIIGLIAIVIATLKACHKI